MSGLKLQALSRSSFCCSLEQHRLSPGPDTCSLCHTSSLCPWDLCLHTGSKSKQRILRELLMDLSQSFSLLMELSQSFCAYSFPSFHWVLLMMSLLWFPFHTSYFYEKCSLNPFLVLFSDKLSHCGGSAETEIREINCVWFLSLLWHMSS